MNLTQAVWPQKRERRGPAVPCPTEVKAWLIWDCSLSICLRAGNLERTWVQYKLMTAPLTQHNFWADVPGMRAIVWVKDLAFVKRSNSSCSGLWNRLLVSNLVPKIFGDMRHRAANPDRSKQRFKRWRCLIPPKAAKSFFPWFSAKLSWATSFFHAVATATVVRASEQNQLRSSMKIRYKVLPCFGFSNFFRIHLWKLPTSLITPIHQIPIISRIAQYPITLKKSNQMRTPMPIASHQLLSHQIIKTRITILIRHLIHYMTYPTRSQGEDWMYPFPTQMRGKTAC